MHDDFTSSTMPVAAEFEAALQHHVVDAWFPRSLDREYGGFLCDFDRRWRPCGRNEKLLEFQARHTWFAAEGSQVYPKNEALREAVQHGYSYLRRVLWDGHSGGWFSRLDRAGRPLQERKRTHGFAYAILACVAIFRATGESEALHFARESFEWLYKQARDTQHGGYFKQLRRDGTLLVDGPTNLIACKDIGDHSGLLEAFIDLYGVWPDERVLNQLREIVGILCNRLILPVGGHHHYYLADWTPVPHLTWFGFHLFIAFRLLRAAPLLGGEKEILIAAQRLIEHAMLYGLDRQRGGFYFGGPGLEPLNYYGQVLMVKKKVSWVQMGALKALLAFHRVAPHQTHYLQAFKVQWRYIQDWLFDSACGGVYRVGLEALPWWQRRWRSLAPISITRKGSDLKDSSHDGLALLYCMSCLKGTGTREGRPDC